MHWFGRGTLDAFLAELSGAAGYGVVRSGESDLLRTLATLPDAPTAVVLEPRFLSGD